MPPESNDTHREPVSNGHARGDEALLEMLTEADLALARGERARAILLIESVFAILDDET